MYNQYERLPEAIARNILDSGKLIHLVRENVLRTFVSDYINRNDKQPAHSRKQREKASWVIPCEGLYQKLRDRQDRCHEFRENLAGRDVIEVSYEQLTADTQAVVDRVFDHLGVASIDASTTLQPSNPWPLREIIVNVDDVEREISGTDLEWMLDH
jgi:LPS sulfotransferase NodH